MRLQNAASLSQPGGIFRSTNSVIQGAANANHLLFSYMMRLLRRPNLRDAAVHQFEIANRQRVSETGWLLWRDLPRS